MEELERRDAKTKPVIEKARQRIGIFPLWEHLPVARKASEGDKEFIYDPKSWNDACEISKATLVRPARRLRYKQRLMPTPTVADISSDIPSPSVVDASRDISSQKRKQTKIAGVLPPPKRQCVSVEKGQCVSASDSQPGVGTSAAGEDLSLIHI